MSGRWRPYIYIVAALIITAFLVGPPLAFAIKLPAACNVFHPKTIIKSGPCGDHALFSKDNPQETGAFPVVLLGLEVIDSATEVKSLSLSPVFPGILPGSLPLRR